MSFECGKPAGPCNEFRIGYNLQTYTSNNSVYNSDLIILIFFKKKKSVYNLTQKKNGATIK